MTDAELIHNFEDALQDLCEYFGVELCVDNSLEAHMPTIYLKKNSSASGSEIVIDPRVRDAIIYEVNTDGPDGPREGFDE